MNRKNNIRMAFSILTIIIMIFAFYSSVFKNCDQEEATLVNSDEILGMRGVAFNDFTHTLRSADGNYTILNFNSSFDRVFGFLPGYYIFNCTLDMKKGYNIYYSSRAYSTGYNYNSSLEIWDPLNRYYHIMNQSFNSGVLEDSAWSTDYGTAIDGKYQIVVHFIIATNISLHVKIQALGAVINEFYPAGKIGDLFYDYRVFNESITTHEFYIPMDSDTEYTFNLIRVTPISEHVKNTYYPGESYPTVNGYINMEGIRFYLWNNISTAGYKQENSAFKVLLGSFTNGTVKFIVEMKGIYTNMVFLFQSYSTQRIGDGPDPSPPSTNSTANNSIDEFFNNTQEAAFKFMFNDSVILIATVVLLISGLFIYLKAQSTVYIIE